MKWFRRKIKHSGFPDDIGFHGAIKPRDWPEDFGRENGCYANVCYRCDHKFIGHKYRHICKICVTKSKKRLRAAYIGLALAGLFTGYNILHLILYLIYR